MDANDWIPLVDRLAEKLGVASSEVAKAVEVLAADYQASCWVAIGLAIAVGVVISMVSFAVRRKAEAITLPFAHREGGEKSFPQGVRIAARVVEGAAWLICLVAAASNAVSIPMARIGILTKLLSRL